MGKTTFDNITEMHDYDVNKSLAQNLPPRSLLQSNRRSDQEDDEIADLPKGDKASNSRSPFKTQNNQNQPESPNEMIFASQNEQDEPPVNILRAVNRDHGSLMTNHKDDKTKPPHLEQFASNQSFNPNQHGRRYDNANNLENVLSSNQDFLSSQSQYVRKNSGHLSLT